jgi:hypothetical protein
VVASCSSSPPDGGPSPSADASVLARRAVLLGASAAIPLVRLRKAAAAPTTGDTVTGECRCSYEDSSRFVLNACLSFSPRLLVLSDIGKNACLSFSPRLLVLSDIGKWCFPAQFECNSQN